MRGECYVTGFQWHPEFHAGASELLDSGPILDDFLAAAEKTARGRYSSPLVTARQDDRYNEIDPLDGRIKLAMGFPSFHPSCAYQYFFNGSE